MWRGRLWFCVLVCLSLSSYTASVWLLWSLDEKAQKVASILNYIRTPFGIIFWPELWVFQSCRWGHRIDYIWIYGSYTSFLPPFTVFSEKQNEPSAFSSLCPLKQLFDLYDHLSVLVGLGEQRGDNQCRAISYLGLLWSMELENHKHSAFLTPSLGWLFGFQSPRHFNL